MEMSETSKTSPYNERFNSYSVSLTPEHRSDGDGSRLRRSKSMSSVGRDTICTGEIRRIRERLLRTNARVETLSIKKFTKKQKMTLISLTLVDFMSFCSMSIMAPFFPREASEKGMSSIVCGFVFSFYALVMFLTSPIFGRILPKVGVKFLFISGIFIAGACNLLFGMLEFVHDNTLFTCYCFLIRGLEALAASAFSTASYVFVVNSFPSHIGSVLGILETFVGIGMSTGPAVGGILYSIGGFQMPFFVLGVLMILAVPINMWLLPVMEDGSFSGRDSPMLKLIKIPAVAVTGLVVVFVSSTWSFLDPTLEPHLRQFDLTPEKIGLIFLLFSALYGASSPLWGWLADKCANHWLMMIWGLLQCTLGLLMLGPCPYIPLFQNAIWLNLIALSILGISVALALLPTFQGVLKSAIEDGWPDSLGTYSMVAGIWSCMYSLGEVLGPSIGGLLLHIYGFPITATIMACMTFSLAILTSLYFILKSYFCQSSSNTSDSGITANDSFYNSFESSENTPLLMSLVESNDNYKMREYKEDENTSDRYNRTSGAINMAPKASFEL